MLKLDSGYDLVKYVESRDNLRVLAQAGKLTSDMIFDDIMKATKESEFMPLLRKWSVQAIGQCFVYEKNRIRNRLKKGLETETVFNTIMVEEIEWDRKVAEIDAECKRNFCADVQKTILDSWIMRNGKRLGDCTAGYIRQEAWRERQLASGHMRNADFYTEITKHLPDDAIMRIKDPKAIERIRARVFGDDGLAERAVA